MKPNEMLIVLNLTKTQKSSSKNKNSIFLHNADTLSYADIKLQYLLYVLNLIVV